MTAITILDGGLGQELIARAGKATPLWSTQTLLDDPDLVRQVHDDYFAAGADLATTNTYAVLPDRLKQHGLSQRLDELLHIACRQAVDARDAHGSGRVAGSLGPLGFSYQPGMCPPAEQAAEVYARACKVQADYVDLFIAETMASIDQARGALMGTAGFEKPVWIAMTVDDDDGTRLRSGEPLSAILPLIAEYDAAALLINCSVPEAVSQAIHEVAGHGVEIGAYANGFTEINKAFNSVGATVDMLESRTDLDPAAYAAFAAEWVDSGATLIGGCCEVGPAHIAELKKQFGS